jgi:hypothetical protein
LENAPLPREGENISPCCLGGKIRKGEEKKGENVRKRKKGKEKGRKGETRENGK